MPRERLSGERNVLWAITIAAVASVLIIGATAIGARSYIPDLVSGYADRNYRMMKRHSHLLKELRRDLRRCLPSRQS